MKYLGVEQKFFLENQDKPYNAAIKNLGIIWYNFYNFRVSLTNDISQWTTALFITYPYFDALYHSRIPQSIIF